MIVAFSTLMPVIVATSTTFNAALSALSTLMLMIVAFSTLTLKTTLTIVGVAFVASGDMTVITDLAAW